MLLRVFVLLTLLFAIATPSMAETRQIASVSASQLKSACDKAGGTYLPPVDGSGYDCIKDNCDGKGGSCIVSCSQSGTCLGSTPRQIVGPQTLISLLQDGDFVLHEVDSMPTGSLASPSEGTTAPVGSAPPVLELL